MSNNPHDHTKQLQKPPAPYWSKDPVGPFGPAPDVIPELEKLQERDRQAEQRPIAPVLGASREGHPLEYQRPTPDQIEEMQSVTTALQIAWNQIVLICPPSAERTLALRSLQEARSRANESILGITIPR